MTFLMPCVQAREVFQHPLVEEPLTGRDNEARQLVGRAVALCESCPLMGQCLYSAVVEVDVAGVVGGTTLAQRARIRDLLGITVAREDLSHFVGAAGERRRVTDFEVARVRRADPDASLMTLAKRLGCSLSTVKRHLRRALPGDAPRPGLSVDVVLAARLAVVGECPSARVS
ncbi:MAG: WhiB family transcriptional regulator [Propionicimonas sp.]